MILCLLVRNLIFLHVVLNLLNFHIDLLFEYFLLLFIFLLKIWPQTLKSIQDFVCSLHNVVCECFLSIIDQMVLERPNFVTQQFVNRTQLTALVFAKLIHPEKVLKKSPLLDEGCAIELSRQVVSLNDDALDVSRTQVYFGVDFIDH